jgi:Putative peptidoglycan binding domain
MAPVPRAGSAGHLRLGEPRVTLGRRYLGKIIRKERDYLMKTKRLALISSLAATVLIASPVLGAPKKKSATSESRQHRMTPRTTQVTPAYHRGTNLSYTGARHYVGAQRYVGTRQYSGGRYYTQNRYAGTRYYGGTRYYYGSPSYYNYGESGSPYYGYYSSWPSASYGYYPSSYYGGYGGYPSSYYRGYSGSYSYYQPGYDVATVAAVQRRLGELGYYDGVVDGIIGPQTQAAIAGFESRNGMVVDGVITTRLLDRIGLT